MYYKLKHIGSLHIFGYNQSKDTKETFRLISQKYKYRHGNRTLKDKKDTTQYTNQPNRNTTVVFLT